MDTVNDMSLTTSRQRPVQYQLIWDEVIYLNGYVERREIGWHLYQYLDARNCLYIRFPPNQVFRCKITREEFFDWHIDILTDPWYV